MTNHRALIFTVLISICAFSISAIAQTTAPDTVLPDRPDAAGASGGQRLVGDVFESAAAGISFAAPAGWKEIAKRGAGGSEIVQYVNEARRWTLSVNRLNFNPPVEMTYHKEKNIDGKGEHDVNGLFEETIDRLKTDSPGIEIDRQEINQTTALEIGFIATRTHISTEDNVTLIALVRQLPVDLQKSRASRIYYSFNLNAPLKRGAKPEDDPDVRQIVETFNQVVESIKLLDQSAIREDQNERLFRTRSLFVSLAEGAFRQVMIPEQWLRLTRDGKDVGYMYIVEESAHDLPRHGQPAPQTGGPDGILIGVRSRTMAESGEQIDLASWEWASFDRGNEKWTSIAAAKGGEAGETYTEIGSMQTQSKLLTESGNMRLQPGEVTSKGVDEHQPAVRQIDVKTLDVFFKGKGRAAPPLHQELSPWYMPQAVLQLLPRVAAKFQGKTYMFAAYNNDSRAVMERYVDVDLEQVVEIGGRRVNAIPVNDRWGWDGSVTTHYVTRDGKYLGSVNRESKIMILPTDRATIEKIWSNANLTPPKELEEK